MGNFGVNSSFQLDAKRFFHFTNADIPTRSRAIQVFFTADGINPVLIQDGAGNCYIVIENWQDVTASVRTVNGIWLNNTNTLEGISCARVDSTTYRVKLTYRSRDVTNPGAFLSLDGKCAFLYQQYVDV